MKLLTTQMKKYDKEYINELINSGITLYDKEIKIVEDYILNQSAYYFPKGYSVPQEILDIKQTKTLRSGAVVKAGRRCK